MGFALLVVIWGLGLISLLVASFASSSRLRLRNAFDFAGAVRAKLIVDGAVDVTISTLLSERAAGEPGTLHDGAPFFCALDGAAVAITTEDEGGKVDINAAPHDLLEAMLTGLGLEMRRADALWRMRSSIFARRRRVTSDLRRGARTPRTSPFPKHAPFKSVLEIDQIAGVDPPLFERSSQFVTIDRRGMSSAHRLKQGVRNTGRDAASAIRGARRQFARGGSRFDEHAISKQARPQGSALPPAFRAPSDHRTL